MLAFRIPREAKQGLEYLATLPSDSLKTLVSELTTANASTVLPSAAVNKIVGRIGSKVKPFSESELSEVLHTLIMIFMVGLEYNLDSEELCKTIVDAAKRDFSGSEDFNVDTLTTNLEELLNKEHVLQTISKGYRLLIDHQRRFSRAKVISDVRTIFARNPERPVAAVITSMLKVTYNEDDTTKEFFVALDTDDLEEMRKAIERAEIKVKALKGILDASNIPYLGTEDA